LVGERLLEEVLQKVVFNPFEQKSIQSVKGRVRRNGKHVLSFLVVAEEVTGVFTC